MQCSKSSQHKEHHSTAYIEFTEPQLTEMYRLYTEDKKSCEDIAKVYGIHWCTVAKRLVKAGIQLRSANKVPKIPDAAFLDIARKRKLNHSWQSIGDVYGVHHSNVQRWFVRRLKEVGLHT